MTTETLEKPVVNLELTTAQDNINSGIVVFNDKKSELQSLADQYKELSIAGIDDKAGYKTVADARKKLKQERVQITKDAKDMRDSLTKVNRFISSKEKELVDIISPVEDQLQAEEDRIDAEKERIRKEAEDRENARVQARIDTLAGFGFEIDYATIKIMADDAFDRTVQAARAEYEKEQADKKEAERLRLEQEAIAKKEREAEAERMRLERLELDRIRAEQAEAQRKIDEQNRVIEAERKRLEDERLAAERQKLKDAEDKRRAEELETAKKEAAEKARLKAIEDARLAAEKKKADEEKARIAAEKKAARQPDKVKLMAFAVRVDTMVDFEMKTPEGENIKKLIVGDLKNLVKMIGQQIETL